MSNPFVITIKKIDGTYRIELSVGVQGFALAYESEDYADMEWYSSMLVKAIGKAAPDAPVDIIRERTRVETR